MTAVQQPGWQFAAMVCAIEASAVHIDHARYGVVRELARLARDHFGRENDRQKDPRYMPSRTNAWNAFGIGRKNRLQLEQRSANVWEKLPLDIRAAAEQIATELLPFALKDGLKSTLARFDREVVAAALRRHDSNVAAVARVFGLTKDAVADMRHREVRDRLNVGKPSSGAPREAQP